MEMWFIDCSCIPITQFGGCNWSCWLPSFACRLNQVCCEEDSCWPFVLASSGWLWLSSRGSINNHHNLVTDSEKNCTFVLKVSSMPHKSFGCLACAMPPTVPGGLVLVQWTYSYKLDMVYVTFCATVEKCWEVDVNLFSQSYSRWYALYMYMHCTEINIVIKMTAADILLSQDAPFSVFCLQLGWSTMQPNICTIVTSIQWKFVKL